MIGASLFLGWCVTLLWLPNIADRKGRKRVFWAGMISQMVFYIGLLVTTNLYVMIAMWFIFGMLSAIRIQVGYVYHMELLPRKWQTPITTIWNI
jgi:MFS family permease